MIKGDRIIKYKTYLTKKSDAIINIRNCFTDD